MRQYRPAFAYLWRAIALVAFAVACVEGQTVPYEKAFPQSKPTIEKALKTIQANLSGRLPVLEGFARPGEHPLNRYQRGYYQTTIQVIVVPTGGSVVRVSAKVTAWYADPVSAHSGYQLLVSNGRLEADLLDQLSDQLMSQAATTETARAVNSDSPSDAAPSPSKSTSEPALAAPSPQFPTATNQPFSSSLIHGMAASPPSNEQPAETAGQKTNRSLQAEADSLEQVLRGMAHPNNLVAVKKSGTPVVESPSLTAKPEFLASMHDEFELIGFNSDWVHVRISGLSRGWIWRNSVDMPDGIADRAGQLAASLTSTADVFHVTREETAVFPGDWEPLRNKSVKIISVQKIVKDAKDAGPNERLEYAKFLLEKNYNDISQKPHDVQGVVLIFDSADGGMIAATFAVLQQWKAGTLTDAALWHKCFFDPPETFDSAPSAGSR